jgi:hypothetical protein
MGTFANIVWANQPTTQMSGEDIARYAYQAGITDPNQLTIAVAVAKAESHWVRDGISVTNDYGIWQINKPAHPSYDAARLLSDPLYNAQAAYTISGGGKNWDAWYTYKPSGKPSGTGPYRNYLNDATKIVSTVMGTTVNLPTNPVSNPPAQVADSPAVESNNSTYTYGRKYSPAFIQQKFDDRHRRVGTRSKLLDIFAGPTYTGVIHPLDPSKNTGAPSAMRNAPAAVPFIDGDPSISAGVSVYDLYFEFNPAEIVFTYQGNPSILPIGSLDESQTDPTLPMADSNTTMSFDLFFDRTYEVMGGSDLGVLTDVRALEQIVGISADRPVMLLSPVEIHFGSPVYFHFPAIISNWSVRYTHFSHDMVPMRCTISVTATRISSAIFASKDDAKTYSADDWRTKAPTATSSTTTTTSQSSTQSVNSTIAPALAFGGI